MRSITVIIRWREGEQEQATEITLYDAGSRVGPPSQMSRELLHKNRKSLPATAVEKQRKQLLPTDRVILDALRRRVPQGEQITTPVRNNELAEECEISRRQVQICLKRLAEKQLIRRLIDKINIGSHNGYSYRLF